MLNCHMFVPTQFEHWGRFLSPVWAGYLISGPAEKGRSWVVLTQLVGLVATHHVPRDTQGQEGPVPRRTTGKRNMKLG